MASSTENACGLREELRSDAQTLADSATQRLQGELDARKGGAATQVQSLSSALESTAKGLGDDTPQWLRSAFEQGAQTLDRLASTVRQKDARALSRDVQQIARDNPGTFLAGCALAGFAAARVFKAGAPETASSHQPQAYAGEEPSFASSRAARAPEVVS